MINVCSQRSRQGMTLIEILVAGALFGLFTGMVAGALVLAHRARRSAEGKLDVIRKSSIALDVLVRDIEAARFSTMVLLGGATALTPAPVTPVVGNELEITRFRHNPGASGDEGRLTQQVVAKYWFDEQDPAIADDGQIRRALYIKSSGALAVGEVAAGRVLVGNLRDFQVSADTPSGLTVIKADVFANSIGVPIGTLVTTERPDPPPP